MIEETHWHPVALCEDVVRQPLAATLLERDLVLWRDATGTVHAWADQCPHRGARLSIGQVVDGRLLPLDSRAELHTRADKASSAYRRHLTQLGITFGVC